MGPVQLEQFSVLRISSQEAASDRRPTPIRLIRLLASTPIRMVSRNMAGLTPRVLLIRSSSRVTPPRTVDRTRRSNRAASRATSRRTMASTRARTVVASPARRVLFSPRSSRLEQSRRQSATTFRRPRRSEVANRLRRLAALSRLFTDLDRSRPNRLSLTQEEKLTPLRPKTLPLTTQCPQLPTTPPTRSRSVLLEMDRLTLVNNRSRLRVLTLGSLILSTLTLSRLRLSRLSRNVDGLRTEEKLKSLLRRLNVLSRLNRSPSVLNRKVLPSTLALIENREETLRLALCRLVLKCLLASMPILGLVSRRPIILSLVVRLTVQQASVRAQVMFTGRTAESVLVWGRIMFMTARLGSPLISRLIHVLLLEWPC